MIANGHHQLSGWSLNGDIKQPIQVTGERQDNQDKCSTHQGAYWKGVIEVSNDMTEINNNGIGYGAAMVAGPKD
jgi:hypothetical protein